MRELEYLLADIPEEEKEEAIGYYKDYLEEAGPDDEGRAISEFGSPERIAAIIRSDISGNLMDGGEFTEDGYKDERFKDPNFQMAKRYDLPEASSDAKRESGSRRSGQEEPPFRTNRTVKIILWIILIIVASPVLLGIGGGAAGLLGGLFGLLVAAVVVLGLMTFAFLAAGLAILLAGIVCMVLQPLNGILLIGISILLLGFGLLFLAVCVWFYGSFLPFLIRTVVDFIARIFQGRRVK